MGHRAGKLNRRRGETLVETIVSFSIIMIMLAMVGTVILSAIRMTQHAATQSALLEGECADVENRRGAAAGTANLVINVRGADNTLLKGNVSIPIDLFKSGKGTLAYFQKGTGGGGGAGG